MRDKTKEPTRVRQRGTRVVRPGNSQERIDAIRSIVDKCQYGKVDGTTVDLFSASAIVKVYDALSDQNKAKFASQPVGVMAHMAFRLIG